MEIYLKKYIQKLLDKKNAKYNLLLVLESRLDIILVRICFFSTLKIARQWITHKKILVNGSINTFSGYQLKPGDVISLNYSKFTNSTSFYKKKLYKTRYFKNKNFLINSSSWVYQNKNTEKTHSLILDIFKYKLKKKKDKENTKQKQQIKLYNENKNLNLSEKNYKNKFFFIKLLKNYIKKPLSFIKFKYQIILNYFFFFREKKIQFKKMFFFLFMIIF